MCCTLSHITLIEHSHPTSLPPRFSFHQLPSIHVNFEIFHGQLAFALLSTSCKEGHSLLVDSLKIYRISRASVTLSVDKHLILFSPFSPPPPPLFLFPTFSPTICHHSPSSLLPSYAHPRTLLSLFPPSFPTFIPSSSSPFPFPMPIIPIPIIPLPSFPSHLSPPYHSLPSFPSSAYFSQSFPSPPFPSIIPYSINSPTIILLHSQFYFSLISHSHYFPPHHSPPIIPLPSFPYHHSPPIIPLPSFPSSSFPSHHSPPYHSPSHNSLSIFSLPIIPLPIIPIPSFPSPSLPFPIIPLTIIPFQSFPSNHSLHHNLSIGPLPMIPYPIISLPIIPIPSFPFHHSLPIVPHPIIPFS